MLVKAGTLRRIVERVTAPEYADPVRPPAAIATPICQQELQQKVLRGRASAAAAAAAAVD